MNSLILKPITAKEEKTTFIAEIQAAFQKSYEDEFGKYDKTILPCEDIEESFDACGSKAYIAYDGDERVGGTIVVLDEKTGCASLDLLYVRSAAQNRGYGFKIWEEIEKMHPNIHLWETHTPYYDKRNIHFYVNRCGFKIVEFFSPWHKDPHQKGETSGNIPPKNNLFFRFEKEINAG